MDAFDRVERCAHQGYHLEAVAILDSLIGDRLASRLSHLKGGDSAMHGVARVFRHDDSAAGFDAAIESHRETVMDEIALLQRFDRLNTAAR